MNLSDLDFSNAGTWPPLAKGVTALILMTAVGGVGYWFDAKDRLVELEGARNIELQLKKEFEEKQKIVANVEAYRERLKQLQALLDTVLKQLPTKTQMPDLLEAVSNTGKSNGLVFELFRPESEQPKEFYAAVPISIRAHATYHQFGAFVGNISALDRIVTVDKVSLVNSKSVEKRIENTGSDDDDLIIDATLQTYRYLDESEQQAVADAQKKKGK